MADPAATVGLLYAAGVDLTWGPLSPADARCVRLPAYPWQKQRLWAAQNPWTAPPPAAVGRPSQAVDSQKAGDGRPAVIESGDRRVLSGPS